MVFGLRYGYPVFANPPLGGVEIRLVTFLLIFYYLRAVAVSCRVTRGNAIGFCYNSVLAAVNSPPPL